MTRGEWVVVVATGAVALVFGGALAWSFDNLPARRPATLFSPATHAPATSTPRIHIDPTVTATSPRRPAPRRSTSSPPRPTAPAPSTAPTSTPAVTSSTNPPTTVPTTAPTSELEAPDG